MTRIFDGMASVINGALGGAVDVTPQGGQTTTIQAIFREGDTPVLTDEGVEVLNSIPTLKGHRDELLPLAQGGILELGDGRRFRCLEPMDPGSPDPRGNVTLQLEPI